MDSGVKTTETTQNKAEIVPWCCVADGCGPFLRPWVVRTGKTCISWKNWQNCPFYYWPGTTVAAFSLGRGMVLSSCNSKRFDHPSAHTTCKGGNFAQTMWSSVFPGFNFTLFNCPRAETKILILNPRLSSSGWCHVFVQPAPLVSIHEQQRDALRLITVWVAWPPGPPNLTQLCLSGSLEVLAALIRWHN